jgi:hypothetical protein
MERDMTSPSGEEGARPIGYVPRHAWPNFHDSSSIVLVFCSDCKFTQGGNKYIYLEDVKTEVHKSFGIKEVEIKKSETELF